MLPIASTSLQILIPQGNRPVHLPLHEGTTFFFREAARVTSSTITPSPAPSCALSVPSESAMEVYRNADTCVRKG